MKAHNFIGAIDECHDKSGWLGYIGTSTVQSCCTPDCRGANFPLAPEIWLSKMVWNRRHHLESCWTTQHYYQDEIPPSFFLRRQPTSCTAAGEREVASEKRNAVFHLGSCEKLVTNIIYPEMVKGHLNPGLFNPKLQLRTFQPQTFQPWSFQLWTFQRWIFEPWGWKVYGWKVWGWNIL